MEENDDDDDHDPTLIRAYLAEPFNEKEYEDKDFGESYLQTYLNKHLVFSDFPFFESSSSSSSSSSAKLENNNFIGTIFFVVEAHGRTTFNTLADLEELSVINKIKDKQSQAYLDARIEYYSKKTMLLQVQTFNHDSLLIYQQKIIDNYEHFKKYVETVKYTSSVPYGYYGILDVYDLDGDIGSDHASQTHKFERLKCPAQRTKTVIDYANEFKENTALKTRFQIDNFFEVLRLRLKQLTKRHFQRAIQSNKTAIKNYAGNPQVVAEARNGISFFTEIVEDDKIMHQYKQSIHFLDKKYSFGTNEDDAECMRGIYIPLIIDNLGRSNYVPANETINIIEPGKIDSFFTDALLQNLLHDMPEKMIAIAKLRVLSRNIGQCVARNESSLWQLYLIGYILRLNVAIIDFSCFGYVDKTKRSTRSHDTGNQPFMMNNDGSKDNNLFSPADERQILHNFISGGKKGGNGTRKTKKKRKPKGKKKNKKKRGKKTMNIYH